MAHDDIPEVYLAGDPRGTIQLTAIVGEEKLVES
jgi:hypothetical protein